MKNPLRLFRLYARGSELLDEFDDAQTDTRLYASEAWWLRVLTTTRELALAAPLPVPVQTRIEMLKNWKTTLAGVAAILAVAAKVLTTGTVDWATDGPAVIAAIGLIAAKDSNVTGGTSKQ